jgi:hypothetical protein
VELMVTTTQKFYVFLFCSLTTFSLSSHAQGFNSARRAGGFRSTRVEELFIWKISEELKLSVKEEKDVSSLIKELNQRKSEANEKIEDLVQKQATSGDTSAPAFLKDYKAAINNYNKISVDEIDRVQKLLPKAKAARYFVVKSDLSKRIRSLLALPEHVRDHTIEKPKGEQSQPLADPKIIEE